eukprot:3803081-Amphidinium_carterae.2
MGQKSSTLVRRGSCVVALSCCWRRLCNCAGATPIAAPQSATAAGPARIKVSSLAPAFLSLRRRVRRRAATLKRFCCSVVRRRNCAVSREPRLVCVRATWNAAPSMLLAICAASRSEDAITVVLEADSCNRRRATSRWASSPADTIRFLTSSGCPRAACDTSSTTLVVLVTTPSTRSC